MNVEIKIRKMARSNYWQSIYRASKSCNGITLFQNNYNFSGIQSLFLYWLSAYSILFDELSNRENKNLTKEVIADNDRTDAYLFVRSKNQEKEIIKRQREEAKGKLKFKKSGNVKAFNLK